MEFSTRQRVLDGESYDEIAREVGYANRVTAHRTVSEALRERVYDAVELARLDSLQVGLWDRAMAGDARAVDGVLKIIDRRIRLLGLDQFPVDGGVDTVVVPQATG